jgi:hypothetical protein
VIRLVSFLWLFLAWLPDAAFGQNIAMERVAEFKVDDALLLNSDPGRTESIPSRWKFTFYAHPGVISPPLQKLAGTKYAYRVSNAGSLLELKFNRSVPDLSQRNRMVEINVRVSGTDNPPVEVVPAKEELKVFTDLQYEIAITSTRDAQIDLDRVFKAEKFGRVRLPANQPRTFTVHRRLALGE